jgi:hypothetical protein
MTPTRGHLIACLFCVGLAAIQIPFMLNGSAINMVAFGWCAALAVFNGYQAWAEA